MVHTSFKELVAPHLGMLKLVNPWLEQHDSNIPTIKGVPVTRANSLLDASHQLCRPTGNVRIGRAYDGAAEQCRYQ
jgi:hypothetical protein